MATTSTPYIPRLALLGAGAMLASFVWFFSLGYGARFLAPLFAKPSAWRILDALIALDPPSLAVALENPPLVFLAPMLAIFLLCLASITFRDQLEAYRRIVSIPASVFIGIVGAYWFVERVFL